ncbi:MAG: peptide deformylase [Verrucomicrobiota bacterium]
MDYQIRTYGDKVLRQAAKRVGEVTDEIRHMADDMLETMYANDGIGLAAEQVGRTEAVCVVDISAAKLNEDNIDAVKMPLVMIDPEIEETSGQCAAKEGCLSFPEIFVEVNRAETVCLAYTDTNGKRQRVDVDGLLARAVQHEIDHLNGVLLVDKMSMVEKVAVSGRLKRLKKQAKAAM